MTQQKNFNAGTNGQADDQRYARLDLDTAWKRCFASEKNKRLLLLLLQNLFPDKGIVSINLTQGEHTNPFPDYKSIRTDVEVIDSKDRRFVVELQMDDEGTFNDRLLYYSAFAMQQQILKGDDERKRRIARGEVNVDDLYDFPSVYMISLLGYSNQNDSGKVLRHCAVMDTADGEVFSNKLNFIIIDMTIGVEKGLKEGASFAEQLSYAILKMPTLKEQPEELSGEFFDMLFNCAEITNFTAAERTEYEKDKMEECVRKAMLERQRLKALAEGEAKGEKSKAIEIAKGMLADGMTVANVAKYTKLSEDEVKALKSN